MIAHPILASEDDEDLVCRTIYLLPDNISDFFDVAQSVYVENRQDLKAELSAIHAQMCRMMEIIGAIPPGSFRHAKTGREDKQMTEGLVQIVKLWNTELSRLHHGVMNWKYPLTRLVQDAHEMLLKNRVRFPWNRRFRRHLSSPQSLVSIALVGAFVVTCFAMVTAILVIPSVQASASTGVAIGAVLSAALLITGALIVASYVSTMEALQVLYLRASFVSQYMNAPATQTILQRAAGVSGKGLLVDGDGNEGVGEADEIDVVHQQQQQQQAANPVANPLAKDGKSRLQMSLPTERSLAAKAPAGGGPVVKGGKVVPSAVNTGVAHIRVPGGAGGPSGTPAGGAAANTTGGSKPSTKKHTKNGFYTISYENGIGFIDGQYIDAQSVMIGFDETYHVTLWNNAAEATTGFLEAECIGKPLSELVDTPSGDMKRDILQMQKQRGGGGGGGGGGQQSIKIRLRAFATAPVTLFTVVAPIVDSDGATVVGSVLICANIKDSLKEARSYIHDYQMHEIEHAGSRLIQQQSLSREDELQLMSMLTFTRCTYAAALEEYARAMVYEWEWTTGNQLFGKALGTLLSKCTLSLDPKFPQTLCINQFVAGTINNAVTEAPSRCEVRACVLAPGEVARRDGDNDDDDDESHLSPITSTGTPAKAHRLHVSIVLPPNSRPYDTDRILQALRKPLDVTCAYSRFTKDDTVLELHFPCQVSLLVDDISDGANVGGGDAGNSANHAASHSTTSNSGSGQRSITCTVNVITLLSNSVDRHNVSMVLLKTIFVSLNNVQDPRDLEKKIAAHEVDVIIADRQWYSTARNLSGHTDDSGIILIPLLPVSGGNEPPSGGGGGGAPESPGLGGDRDEGFGGGFVLPKSAKATLLTAGSGGNDVPMSNVLPASGKGAAAAPMAAGTGTHYVIYSPIERAALEKMMLDVARVVEEKKAAIAEREEREKILMLRQDSPWTQGKLLGRGAFGAVYEAISDLTGGKMAVKMFYFRREGEEGYISELLNEIKIMCSLNHPNIVHYFYCERKDNSVNLFMELCDMSLADYVLHRNKRAGLALKAWNVLRQVVSAVGYLHGRGIAHRDIKPQNILIKGDKIKLTDFGTSRQVKSDEEQLLDTQGTFRYMAPEVYRGEAHTVKCDIWSIGCLALELFGCVPKFMENRHATLLGEMTEVELPPQVSGPLKDFAQQCVCLNPHDRPSAQMLLLHPLLSESAEVDALPTVFDKKESNRHAMRQGAMSMSSSSQAWSSEGERW